MLCSDSGWPPRMRVSARCWPQTQRASTRQRSGCSTIRMIEASTIRLTYCKPVQLYVVWCCYHCTFLCCSSGLISLFPMLFSLHFCHFFYCVLSPPPYILPPL